MKTIYRTGLLFVYLATMFLAPRAKADTVVVACKSEFQLALVDPATEKVLVKLPTGRGPHEVAVSRRTGASPTSPTSADTVFIPQGTRSTTKRAIRSRSSTLWTER